MNAEGTGFVLEHCRKAKAALVMSTVTIYKPHPDPWHAFREDDPLGDAMAPPSAPYSVSKIAEEAVARYCARSFDLPVTIARMGAAYGDQGGLPVWHLDAVAAGEPVRTRWDPMPYSPIHDDDICAQLEPLLDAASVPATIVNWAGDEPVSVQEWSRVLRRAPRASRRRWWWRRSPARRAARSPTTPSAASITGPCRVGWREGFRRVAEHFYPTASGRDRMSPERDAAATRRSDALMAEAMEATGLSDFGPGDFREGLDVLLESLERDADLSPATDAARRRRPAAAPRQPARGRGVVRASIPRSRSSRCGARSTSTDCRAPAPRRSPT